MSNITSAGNLSVSSALNVGTNTILGTSGTNTLICNATSTFNNGLNVTGNIAQSGSSTLSSGSGAVNLNGDVTITGTKKLTSGTGLTTINGLLQVNGSSITNNGLLTNIGNIEIGPNSTSAYIDLKTINGNSDYDGRLIVSGGSSSVSGQGTMNIISSNCTISSPLTVSGITNNTNSLTNNAILYQNNSSTFSNYITAPGIKSSNASFYCGSSNDFDTTCISSPKIINGIASGPSDGATYTSFNLAINSWNGVGFVYSNALAPSICNLVIDNRTGNLKSNGSISTSSITSGPISSSGDINTSSTTSSSSTTTGALIVGGGVGIGGNVYIGGTVNTSNVTLNSQKIYSVTTLSSINNYLGNNNLYELYLITTGNAATYLPQTPSNGTKITIRRIFVGTLSCDIYSYNSVANTIVLNGQTSATNYLSIAASTGITSATFYYYSGLWYQI